MFSLTKEEKVVLWILASVICAGSFVQTVLKKFPQLKDIVNLIESERIYPKVDINQASYEELVDVPYIGPMTAKAILEYRQKHGSFISLEQLKTIHGIKEKNYRKFIPFLAIAQKK